MKEEQPGREPTEVQKLLKGMLMGLGILFIVGLIFVNIQECNRSNSAPKTPPSTEQIHNALLKKQNELLKIQLANRTTRIDTVIIHTAKAKQSAIETFNWSLNVSPDTCHDYLIINNRKRDITDSLRMLQIASKDSSIQQLNVLVANQDTIIRNDAVIHERDVKAVSDTSAYWQKWGRRRGRKAFGIGFATGVAADRIGTAIERIK